MYSSQEFIPFLKHELLRYLRSGFNQLQSKSLLLSVRRVPALITSERSRIDGCLIRWLYARDYIMGQSIDPASEAICALMVSPVKKRKQKKSPQCAPFSPKSTLGSKDVSFVAFSCSVPLHHYKHNSQLSANRHRSIPFCTYMIGGWFSSSESQNNSE